MRIGLTTCAIALALALAACGDDDEPPDGSAGSDAPVSEDPGPIHVHGLGTNPADGALYIATHTGMFRVPPGETEASRIGDSYQDTMGFTVVGPDRFLGSGHPDGRDDLPPFLGLIESRDGGESWQPVSLLGESDFHVLEARGDRVYGFGTDWESREPQFLVSEDGGESWEERAFPKPFVSLAIHPKDPNRLVASGVSDVYSSHDAGRTWRLTASGGGLLAWRTPGEIVMVAGDGAVRTSTDASGWRDVGSVGGQPAAFEAEGDGLYVALHDGSILNSTDGGRSWKLRSQS